MFGITACRLSQQLPLCEVILGPVMIGADGL
jgi:hypothetical protein